MKTSSRTLVFCLCAVLCGKAFPVHAGQPQKIAILPLTTGGQDNIEYIAEGLRDMIASRVASGSGLMVIEQAAVTAKYSGGGRETPSVEKVRGLGRALGADYVIFGSAARMGSDLIIAVNLLSVSGEPTPIPVFTQTLGLDEVIPRLQLIAQEVRSAVEDGMLTPESDVPPVPPLEESPVGKHEEGSGSAAGGSEGPDALMENDESLKPGEPAEIPGTVQNGETVQEEGEAGTAGEQEEGEGGLMELLFKRKGDIQAPPENPAYEKSVDELEGAAETQPKAD